MPLAQLYEFMAYESIEPFGERRADIQAASICATTFNAQRTKKSDKIFRAADFMPNWDRKPKTPRTPEQELQMILAMQAEQNGFLARQAAQAD